MSSQELINEINSTQYAEDDLSDQMLDTTGYNDGIVAANAPKAVQFITYKAIFKIMHGWSKPPEPTQKTSKRSRKVVKSTHSRWLPVTAEYFAGRLSKQVADLREV